MPRPSLARPRPTAPRRPESARAAGRPDDGGAEGDADRAGDGASPREAHTDAGAARAPLVERLEALAEAGELDPRALADALDVAPASLEARLADPATLDAAQQATVVRLLGVTRAQLPAARGRATAPAEDAAFEGTSDAGDRRAAADARDGVAPTDGTRAASLFAPPPRPAALASPPRSALEAVERALAAVRDDVVGQALRVGALDVAEQAARARGRALPPAVHELRARLARGALPWSGAGAEDAAAAPAVRDAADERARRAADAPLVDATATLVRILQHAGSGWDDLFAPLHDDAVAALLPRHTLVVHAVAAPRTERAVLLPPLFGRHLLVVSEAAGADERRLAVRRALAHLAAGHLDEAHPLPEPAPDAWQALADGAALADLLPFWQLADLRRRGRMGWRALEAWVADAVRARAPGWAEPRVSDAARRRVALWRAAGL